MKRKLGKYGRRRNGTPNINIHVSEGEGVRCECKLGSTGLSGIIQSGNVLIESL